MKSLKFIWVVGVLFLLGALSSQDSGQPRVLIKFTHRPGQQQLDSLQRHFGLVLEKVIPRLQVYRFQLRDTVQIRTLMRRLKSLTSVTYVELEQVMKAQPGEAIAQESRPEEKRPVKVLKAPPKPEIIPGEIIIRFKPTAETAAMATITQQFNLKSIKRLPRLNALLYQFPTTQTLDSILKGCRNRPEVLYAEPNYRVYALAVPNDPDFPKLWGLHNTGQGGGKNDADIDAPEAWDKTQGRKEILISVIDTGIDYNHPDLAANMWTNPGEIPNNNRDDDNNGYVDDVYGYDFVNNDPDPMDDNRHGTHVAGTIGAVGNNDRGVVGVNWTVRLMALKFLSANGSGSTADAAEAIIYAADNGAMITNNSWGGGGFSQTLRDAIEYAKDKGVLFIAAAGNESKDNDDSPNYPSNYEVENVIAVAASTDRDALASFSNWGNQTVDLAAPGEDVYSTTPANTYEYLSGTSMATPHVAGAAGLVWAFYYPNTNWREVKYRLFGAVDFIPDFEGELLLEGRLNVNEAVTDKPLVAVIQKPEDTNDTAGPYPVQASAVDDDTVSTVKLYYEFSGATSRQDTLNMAPVSPYVFGADIPGAPAGTTVKYKVMARDTDNNLVESHYYSFTVGEAGACCGALALTLDAGDASPPVVALLTLLLNLALLVGPVLVFKKRFLRR